MMNMAITSYPGNKNYLMLFQVTAITKAKS